MADHAASRRAFLGASAAGAGTAAFAALSLDRALAEPVGEPAPELPSAPADLGGSSTAGTDPLAVTAALPPAVAGAVTRTYTFAHANGFAAGSTSPLSWNFGAYQPGGGFIDVPLDLEPGSVIKRIDIYVRRDVAGSIFMSLNRASITSSTSGSNVDTITTASGTGLLTGGKAMSVPVAAGEQYYVESNQFGSSDRAFVGLIVTYLPASPQLHLLAAPVRVYDSRPGNLPAVGVKAPLADATRAIDCRTGGAVPAGAKAALVTLTMADTGPLGFMTLYKNGITAPNTSTINWEHAGQVIATTTVVALDGSGQLAAKAVGSANFVVDVIGYYA